VTLRPSKRSAPLKYRISRFYLERSELLTKTRRPTCGGLISNSRLSTVPTALVALAIALTNCGPKILPQEQETAMAETTIKEVLKRNTDWLMSIPGVVGTAIGECGGKPCIMVLVVKKTPELTKQIPSELQGFPIVIEETGVIRPLEKRARR
jgi:hypothetical protein